MELPLIQLSTITDLFADDIDHVEVIGDHVRMVYWTWTMLPSKRMERVALKFAIVRPLRSFRFPITTWPNIVIASPPSTSLLKMH